MCGIAGFARAPGASIPPADVRIGAMCDAIRHRGPDDSGVWVGDGAAIGMRRLSIIDVAGGHQPIANEDGSVIVVFNGEIYNHRELRARLLARGHRFKTNSDTETLVHLYEDERENMVHALRGMFTFAIWDRSRQRLFLARDRLGIKPLYYWPSVAGSGLAFASELRSFLALDDFPRTLSRRALAQYLAFGYVPDPDCVFTAAHKLAPGCTLSWDREHGLTIGRYWSASSVTPRAISEQDAIDELGRLLDDAVRSHLESEVPLGAFLSGGIDSSTVVALMARAMDRRPQTFSIGFEQREFNEAPDAALVAREIGTHHTELVVRPDADELVEEVVGAFDEPFADPSALPTFIVAKLARQHVTVALSGDGGDELFAGYTRYADVTNQWQVPDARLQRLIRSVVTRLPQALPGRNRLLDLARTPRGRYASTVSFPLNPHEGGVASPEVARLDGDMDERLSHWFDDASGHDFLTQLTLVDIATYLPGDILTKVDRTTMAVSLEARVPLLDHPLVEFAVALPAALKMRDTTGKWILRRAVEKLIPGHVLRKPKQGFGVPLDQWFRAELRPRLEGLASPNARIAEYVDSRAVNRVVGEHLLRRRDHYTLLWRLVVLELWLAALDRGVLSRPTSPSGTLLQTVERARVLA